MLYGSIPLKGPIYRNNMTWHCKNLHFLHAFSTYLVEHTLTDLAMYGFLYLFRGFITAISCQSTDF